MREIKKCSICEPSYSCISNGDGRLYYFKTASEYHAEPQSIYDCPVFRGKVSIEENKPNLTNWKTGETYDKL